MPFTEILTSQLTDPFRIGLVIALVFTMMRNRAATGILIPLITGVLFVSVILPTTMGAASPVPFWQQVGVGVISTGLILAVVLAVWQAVRRLRG